MEILRTLGQIPFMFIGALLVVLAVALAWAVTKARGRGRVTDL